MKIMDGCWCCESGFGCFLFQIKRGNSEVGLDVFCLGFITQTGRTLGGGCCQKSSGQKSYQHVWVPSCGVYPSQGLPKEEVWKVTLPFNELLYCCYAVV